jgi:dsRNA-specific ribonuclease
MSHAFTDNHPDYIVERRGLTPETTEVTAKVVLPSLLDPSLRVAHSKSEWRTEKAAKRDAAYQAYFALYTAGLVDDHLMPSHRKKYSDPETTTQEKQVKLAQVSGCWSPWHNIAQLRRSGVELIPTRVSFEANPLGVPDMFLLLPSRIPCDWSFELFWNQDITLRARVCNDRCTTLDVNSDQAARFTHQVLYCAYEGRMASPEVDFLTSFWPAETINSGEEWLLSTKGKYDATTIQVDQCTSEQIQGLGMARIADQNARPFFIEQVVKRPTDDIVMQEPNEEPTAPVELETHLQGTTFPKRADFLHPIAQTDQLPLAHTAQQSFPERLCRIDRLPARFAKFALFIPSITHNIEILFVAERLAKTVLSRVQFSNLGHVLTAISASMAKEATDYQRYEFLGDSLLKLITSIHLVANNPLWHEGLLSAAKDGIVSNERLARTARELGLDRFILTKSFTGRKWRPYYASQFTKEDSQSVDEKRELSTKTLADVVEALMGAAFLDGGYEKLESCAKVFMPEKYWSSIDTDVNTLYADAVVSEQASSHPKLAQMEEMLGYKFNKPSILFEALTHPCSNDGSPTYQRLEFLGDSLLDHFVVQELFPQPEKLSHQNMHLMRTAVVNAHFLGFLCQSLYITEQREEAAEPGKAHLSTVQTEHKIYLWQMMRHGASWEIVNAQQETQTRYEKWGAQVHNALKHAPNYPWAELFRINPSKFFSDIIESILGAIFVDSQGSLDAGRDFLERIGVLPYLRRIIHEKVEILHPFNQVREAARSEKVEIRSRVEGQKAAASDGDDGSGNTETEQNSVYICTVLVGNEEIVELADGVNKLEVETRAAALAAGILKARIVSPRTLTGMDAA